MKLRKARPSDTPALARLSSQLGYPADEETVGERLSRILADPDHFVFVADVDGVAAAWIHVCAVLRLESEPFGEIGGLVVDETARGQGFGVQLVEAAEKWARKRGLAELRVRSNVMREDASRFYEKRGFGMTKRQGVFTRQLTKDEDGPE